MANYLPVLLVSVSTNAVPDDSSLVTLPRGQVDYLSHDWQEEDVWRSWRNMTRQKNEITNGARLENASWRTWWKQRNKLKTVSPETLNWLKDSDVTWLYGPLHTAVEWTLPPKPAPVPDTVDSANPASAHDRLDLSSNSSNPRRRIQPAPSKPILKHRSISELLTSDFPPTSPIFSPVESEDDEHHPTSQDDPASHPHFKYKRPTLTHTKSDTHITRWGASRAFRKDSPPRIDPPGLDSNNSGYFPFQPSASSSSLHQLAPSGPIRSSISQDSNSSASGSTGVTSGGERTHQTHKKKHISFNTFVEQCIAIEKPKKNASGFFGVGNHNEDGVWIEGRSGFVDDDGYDEDQEDSEEEDIVYAPDSQWQHGGQELGARAIRDDSDSPIEEEGEEEDDDVIEMRSSTHRNRSSTLKPKSTPKKPPRSQSKVSTTSSSSSTSTSTTTSSSSAASHSTTGTSTSSPSSSLSPSRRNGSASSNLHRKISTSSSGSNLTATYQNPSENQQRHPFSTSTYRPSAYRRGQPPPLIRTTSDHVHVTIAPIAPTILKTTGAWTEGFGDEEQSDNDGFGGMFGGAWPWATGPGSADKRSSKGGKGRGKGAPSGGPRVNANAYGPFGTTTTDSIGSSSNGGSNNNTALPRQHSRGHGFSHIATGVGLGLGGGDRTAEEDSAQCSDGTPVELVYVPPLGSNYSLGLGEPEGEYHGGGVYGGYGGHGASGVYGRAGPYYGYAPRGYEEVYDRDGERLVEDEEEGAEEDEEEVDAHEDADEQRLGGPQQQDEDDDTAAVYHHPPSPGGSVGSAPIPIASVPLHQHEQYHHHHQRSSHPAVPTVVVGTTSTSAPSAPLYMMRRTSTGSATTINGAAANAAHAHASIGANTHANNANVEEEDAYDFFGGPDLGEDYYARRGGRGYERERDREAKPAVVVPNGYLPNQQQGQRERERENRDRGSDRRQSRSGMDRRSGGREGAGEDRQSRSRSRSQSRTPSPAFLSSPSTTAPTTGVPVPTNTASTAETTNTNTAMNGRRRSSSASSPSGPGTWMSTSYSAPSFGGVTNPNSNANADLLAPPPTASTRGRQPDMATTASGISSGRPPQADSSRQGRGRSSTRTPSSSSSSWERDRERVGGWASPIGSLSPDGGASRTSSISSSGAGGAAAAGVVPTGIGAVLDAASVLAASGRMERGEREAREAQLSAAESQSRRGRERRGRDRTSGKVLSASETESVGRDSSMGTGDADGSIVAEGSVVGGMDASFYSTTSSGSSNTSTVMGPSTPIPEAPLGGAAGATNATATATTMAETETGDAELRYLRRAEEDQRRKVHPTPSNSPMVEVRRMAPADVGKTFVVLADVLPPSTLPPPGIGSGSGSGSSGGTTPTGGASTLAEVARSVASSASSLPSVSLVASSSSSVIPTPNATTAAPTPATTTSSPSKMRPPPLIPTPPGPAKPSTSFTAVSSPRTTVGPVAQLQVVQMQQQQAHPNSIPSPGGNVNATAGGGSESTIVGKAVDIMSSAGAFLGLWGRDAVAAAADAGQ